MKTLLKKVLSCFLALNLCISLVVPAFAANENNTLGVTFSAALNTEELTVSESKQTVTLTVSANKEITLDGLGATLTCSEGITKPKYDEIFLLEEKIKITAGIYENGKFGWSTDDAENTTATQLIVATFTVPANTPAGTYEIGVTDMEITRDYGGTIWENTASASATLTIKAPEVAATGISLDKETLSLKVGGTETLTATVEPTNSTDEVVWSSSDEAVATVENGVVTAKAIGTATITATAGDVSASCSVTVACAHTNKTNHAAQDSTCKVRGWDAYSECECGQLFDASNNEISEIPYRSLSINHTGGTATCEAKAICSVCEQPYGDLADHSYGELIAEKAATHTSSTLEAGMKAHYKCSVCGNFFDEDKNPTTEEALIIAAPTHVYDQEKADAAYLKSAATCTEAAVYFKSCVCGAKGTEEFTYGSANGHSMTATPAKEATCTATGNKAYWTCLTCGKVYADAEGNNKTTVEESTLPMKEHTPVWNKDNTHHWQECSVETCKAVIEGTKKEHTYPDTWTNNSEAGHSKTCTEGNCAHVLSEAHTFDQKNTDSKYLNGTADCQTPASYFYSCVCGEKGSEAFDTEKGNHKVEYVEAKSHTCTEDGVIAHWKCTVAGCNKYFEDKDATKEITDIVDKAPGHNYVTVPHEDHVKVEATCTSAAVYNTYCSVCGDENGETFNGTEMKPHDTTPTAAVAETCTTDGNYAYWTCSACSQHFKDSLGKDAFENLEATIIPKTGHSMTETPAKAPTCEEAGTEGYFTCSNSCGKVYEDEAGTTETTVKARAIPKLGHKFDDNTVQDSTTLKAPATCKAPAEYWYTCSNENCDEISTEDYYTVGTVAPHSTENTKKTEAKAETCTEDGIVAHWDCTHCGTIFADNDGALGEEITEADTVIKAHGHTEATSWSADDETHWKVCACEKGCSNKCGVMIESTEAAHDWVKQDSSTETRNDFKCSVCEATKSEDIIVEKPSAPSVDRDDRDDDEDDDRISSSDVKDAFEDAKGDKVTIKLGDDEEISKRVFTELQKDPDMTVVLKGDGYSWTFDGSDVDGNIKSAYFDASVRNSTPKAKAIKKLTGNADIQHVRLGHTGDLPGMATLTVTVDKDLRSKPINVYFYNAETKTLELVASGLTAKNGKVSFTLSEGGDYILTNDTFGTVAEKVNPETGALDLSAAAFAVVAMAGCAVVGFKKK